MKNLESEKVVQKSSKNTDKEATKTQLQRRNSFQLLAPTVGIKKVPSMEK